MLDCVIGHIRLIRLAIEGEIVLANVLPVVADVGEPRRDLAG